MQVNIKKMEINARERYDKSQAIIVLKRQHLPCNYFYELIRNSTDGREEMQIQLVSEQQAGWLPPIAAIVSTSPLSLLPLSCRILTFPEFPLYALYTRAK